jgi:hypothetical protein
MGRQQPPYRLGTLPHRSASHTKRPASTGAPNRQTLKFLKRPSSLLACKGACEADVAVGFGIRVCSMLDKARLGSAHQRSGKDRSSASCTVCCVGPCDLLLATLGSAWRCEGCCARMIQKSAASAAVAGTACTEGYSQCLGHCHLTPPI